MTAVQLLCRRSIISTGGEVAENAPQILRQTPLS